MGERVWKTTSILGGEEWSEVDKRSKALQCWCVLSVPEWWMKSQQQQQEQGLTMVLATEFHLMT
jgi:hypothetical protein